VRHTSRHCGQVQPRDRQCRPTSYVVISALSLSTDMSARVSLRSTTRPPLDNIRVMVIVWSLRGNIIRTAPCWVVLHNVHSQQHTYVSSSCRSSRLGLSHWDPYAMRRGGCLELYYCNMVEWCWWDSSLIWRPTGFLQCFDTVGLVMTCKIVPDMTYNVSSGTLSLYTTTVGRQTIRHTFSWCWLSVLLVGRQWRSV